MVGLLPSGEQPVPISLAITRELELVGSFRFNDEIDEVIAALADGTLNVDPVITHEFPLAEALEAFDVARTPPLRQGPAELCLTGSHGVTDGTRRRRSHGRNRFLNWALNTQERVAWHVTDFSRRDPAWQRVRRPGLVCPACRGPAQFRSASANRKPTFIARHKSGCVAVTVTASVFRYLQ